MTHVGGFLPISPFQNLINTEKIKTVIKYRFMHFFLLLFCCEVCAQWRSVKVLTVPLCNSLTWAQKENCWPGLQTCWGDFCLGKGLECLSLSKLQIHWKVVIYRNFFQKKYLRYIYLFIYIPGPRAKMWAKLGRTSTAIFFFAKTVNKGDTGPKVNLFL